MSERARAVAGLALRTIPSIMGSIRSGLREAGTSSPQRINVLRVVRKGGRTVGELADFAGVSAPTMSAVVAALEGDGLLTRTQDPVDRRRVVVEATEQGSRKLAEMDRTAKETISQALATLSDDELDRIEDGLNLLVQALDAHRHWKGVDHD